MSRHRNVRSMNYTDDYDGYDDEYGQSVEDDYCISPSDAAQFMYDRNRQSTQISAFFNETENIAEETEAEDSRTNVRSTDTLQKPPLSELEEARLQSCLDEIRNVIGDTIPENIIIETILKNSFDLSKSLDAVLFSEPSGSKLDDPKPQRDRRERNRDDDYSDFYPCVQSHLTKSKEHTCYSIHCNNQKPQHNYLERDFSLLNPLAVDSVNFSSDFNMNENNLSKECLPAVNERPGKFDNLNTIHEPIDFFKNSGMLKMNSESSSDRITTVNSGFGSQLKLQIPRFQKLRKDSDKENIAVGDDLDSGEIAFSSLTALAKQYSSENIQGSSEKEAELLEIKQSEILKKTQTAPYLRNYAMRNEFSIDFKRLDADCEKLVKCGSQSFDCTDTLHSANEILSTDEHQFEQFSKNDETCLLVDNTELASENGMAETFSKLSTHCTVERARTPGNPASFTLPLSDKKANFLMCNDVPCLKTVKSNENTALLSEKQNLSSLSEIFKNHLHKSSSHCDKLQAVSNYDVMKSESCPQFVIPRLHGAPKRRGFSESLSDGGQDVKICIGSMDNIMTDEDNETDNWVIDLKCALKTVQKDNVKDDTVIGSSARGKYFHIDSPTSDHFFVPDLPCLLDASNALREKYSQSRREPSPFGKVLCRKWKFRHIKNLCKMGKISGKISRFTFDTPSPDDDIVKYFKW